MLTNELKELARTIKEVVFDIETDNLLHDYKNVWCICIQDVLTKQILTFHDFPEFTGEQSHTDKADGVTKFTIPERDGSLTDGARFLHLAGNKEATLICHNVINFDRVVLEQTFPKFKVPIECWHDTLLQSQIQLFDRNPVKGCKGVHGLEPWGIRVGVGKPKVVDYTVMTPWLLWRCIKDVAINTKVYLALEKERKMLLEDFGLDSTVPMETEKLYAKISVEQEMHGCLLDKEHAERCVIDLDEKIEKLRLEVEPQLPLYCLFGGGTKETTNYIATKLGLPKIPAIKYEMEEDADGNMVQKPIKKWWKLTDSIWKVEKRTSYEVTYKEVLTGEHFEKLKEAREWISKQVESLSSKREQAVERKLYNTVKTVKEFQVPNKNTCDYFGLSEEECGKILGGAFTKVEVLRPTLTQHEKVKKFLLSLGWRPLEYNYKKKNKKFVRDDRGQLIETSPKLTEESYASLPEGIGKSIAEFNTYNHRRRYLENSKDDEKGLLNMVRFDGRLSAGIRTAGTATMRGAQTVIVNLPSPNALYGEPMRKCVIAPKGRKLVGCDQSGAQLRLAADFAGNLEYGKALVEGSEFITNEDGEEVYAGTDAHTINCIGFGLATEEQRDEAVRSQTLVAIREMGNARKLGKNSSYATIFGASGKKVANMLGVAESLGEERKKSFFDKLGLTQLIEDLVAEWKENKYGKGGFIKTLGGYYVFCQSEHKVLNYFIQGCEAIIQRHAIIMMDKYIVEENLDTALILNVHDEILHECSEEHAERVAELLNICYSQAAKDLGVKIKFGGDSKIGMSYYEVH